MTTTTTTTTTTGRGRRIGLREARVRTATATVEIRTLSVSGKQLPLAVFRQIPAAAALVMTYNQAAGYPTTHAIGSPWGHVNDHDGGCPDGEHLHVVLESAGRLFHARVARRGWYAWFDEYRPLDPAEAQRWREGMPDDWEEHYDRLASLPQLFIAV